MALSGIELIFFVEAQPALFWVVNENSGENTPMFSVVAERAPPTLRSARLPLPPAPYPQPGPAAPARRQARGRTRSAARSPAGTPSPETSRQPATSSLPPALARRRREQAGPGREGSGNPRQRVARSRPPAWGGAAPCAIASRPRRGPGRRHGAAR